MSDHRRVFRFSTCSQNLWTAYPVGFSSFEYSVLFQYSFMPYLDTRYQPSVRAYI